MFLQIQWDVPPKIEETLGQGQVAGLFFLREQDLLIAQK